MIVQWFAMLQIMEALLLKAKERERLIVQYTPLAHKLAARFSKTILGQRLGSYEDCAQSALIGLIKAADGWKPDGGAKFITYAWLAIWRAMERAGVESGVVKISSNAADTVRKGDRDETEEAMAVQAIAGLRAWSLPDEWDDTDGEPDEVSAIAMADKCRWLLGRLPKMEQMVVGHSFGIGLKKMSHDEIGAVFGLSRQRVQQIEHAALERMRRIGKPSEEERQTVLFSDWFTQED